MRLRRLVIRIQTDDGLYGTTLDFSDGLTVVWADNSMGKSTCLKSMLVALGLEAMLTTQADLPLAPAMKTEIEGVGGASDRHVVLESNVFLEIENRFTERITIHRTIKGTRDSDLITVHRGPALTSPKSFPSTDFFVRRAGAASREAGFHHFLAKFLGWKLPEVQTFDGKEYPLYLQCVFPFLFVEQTRGWGSIQPPIPTHFRIRDVHKRAVEFILDLDAHRVALRRQELRHEQENLRAAWLAKVEKVKSEAANIDGVIHALPETPTASWPPEVSPSVFVPKGEEWLPAEHVVEAMGNEWKQLVGEEIPRVEEITAAAEGELAKVEWQLKEHEVLYSRLLESLEMEQEEAVATENRMRVIDEDLQRNKDVRVLKNLGSNAMTSVNEGVCPICRQTLPGSLVPLEEEQTVMSLEENIQFLAEQRRMCEGVFSNSQRIIGLRKRKLQAIGGEMNGLRTRIRALRQTLVADGRLPSIAAIQNRLQLEDSCRKIERTLERIQDIVEEFETLADLWRQVQEELGKLPADDTTDDDKVRIDQWSHHLREQLDVYDFRSLPPSTISISTDTYRPEREGFDVTPSISASDLIRTIWAYLTGMLELAREAKTNHPGLIVFDEPRQQSTKEVSFRQLLRRASSALEYGQQVIFFTSEATDNLRNYLEGLPHVLTKCEGRMIQKLS